MILRWTATARRAVLLTAAAAAHLVVLAGLPLAIRGGDALLPDFRAVLLLALVTGWFLQEAAAESGGLRPWSGRWGDHASAPILLCVFWLALLDQQPTGPPWSWLTLLSGSAGLIVGAGARLAAVGQLGPQFLDDTAGMPGQDLVTSGIYGWIRHPSELGTLCLAWGAAILMASAWAFAVTSAVLLPVVFRRVAREDRLLAATHGTRFRRYATAVPALVPRPWAYREKDNRHDIPDVDSRLKHIQNALQGRLGRTGSGKA